MLNIDSVINLSIIVLSSFTVGRLVCSVIQSAYNDLRSKTNDNANREKQSEALQCEGIPHQSSSVQNGLCVSERDVCIGDVNISADNEHAIQHDLRSSLLPTTQPVEEVAAAATVEIFFEELELDKPVSREVWHDVLADYNLKQLRSISKHYGLRQKVNGKDLPKAELIEQLIPLVA